MVKRLIRWLYVKYILMPDLEDVLTEELGLEIYEIEFEPCEEFQDRIDAAASTKH